MCQVLNMTYLTQVVILGRLLIKHINGLISRDFHVSVLIGLQYYILVTEGSCTVSLIKNTLEFISSFS